ncbi:hypothetical protein SEA_DEJAVU_95 [Microbacterium Phage DejaVu]|nr:hypothetical protein SEA_ROMAN_96 [Microbacterium phage Roman]WNM66227.1 hypothetical protein SEA_DEJAVU_95 [Microbacterium Phage DejaVu]
MSDQGEALAEELADIDEAIRQLDVVIDNTGWVSTLKIAGDAKADLLRERRETVEQLEALGLEDPAS